MAANQEDLTILNGILQKQDNPENVEAMEEILPQYKMTAAEIVGQARIILAHENELKQTIKGVYYNGVLHVADENGTITLVQLMDSDTYGVAVYSDFNPDNTKIMKTDDKFEVNLRYSAVHTTTAGQSSNYNDQPGTMVIAVSSNGSTFREVYRETGFASRPQNEDSFPIKVELGQYCEEGTQRVRVQFFTSYQDSADQWHQTQATGVVFTVNMVNLRVKNLQSWVRPINAADGGFPMTVMMMGAVRKYLHIKISGRNGTYYDIREYDESIQRPEANPLTWNVPEDSAYGILTHGVHTVTLWVTCAASADESPKTDGSRVYYDGISSEVVVNRFMVVNTANAGTNLYKPYLILQGVISNATNYVRTKITEYAVWIPDTNNPLIASTTRQLRLSIRLTDSHSSTDLDYKREYYKSDVTVVSSTPYDVDTTIEIEKTDEGNAPKEYQAYFRVFQYDENNGNLLLNIMNESIGSRFGLIKVDNSIDYSPCAGAHFFLNPKTRNNTETNWQSIINQVNPSDNITSHWEGFGGSVDGWVYDEKNQKVLRVLAGQKLVIDYEPWAAFKTNPEALMTLEIDFAVRNITAEDDPIIDICQTIAQAGQILGLRMKPLTGYLMAMMKATENDQDFGYQENTRTHVVITLDPRVTARNASDEFTWQTVGSYQESTLSLCKVYINGFLNREFDYDVTQEGIWYQGEGYGGIKIGNEHADVDIYGIRCYRGTALSSQGVLQNYIASLSSAEEKNKILEDNNILDGLGRISYEKVNAKHKRCLTLYGIDQYKLNQNKEPGYECYWDIQNYDNDGNYLPEYSGTIGKAAYEAYLTGSLGGKACMMNTPQGSTANTYWANNEQTKIDGITYKVRVKFSQIHSDFGWKDSYAFPTKDGDKDVPAANPCYWQGQLVTTQSELEAYKSGANAEVLEVEVLDGWFDGNGMYHGQCYVVAKGAAKATKLVNKINYASPMQSHKMGATRLYTDIMMKVTGGGMKLHKDNLAARFSVLEESFYFFNKKSNDREPVYVGLSTFGQGKCDKPSWGFKSSMTKMCTFEGANNNLPLTDFRVPFDSDVTYVPSEEAWMYKGTKQLDFDLGATTKDADGKKWPHTDAVNLVKRFVNFIYTHDVNIKFYNGSESDFRTMHSNWLRRYQADETDVEAMQALDDLQSYKWWFTVGDMKLIRYNFVSEMWVDAGTWVDTTDPTADVYAPGVRNLQTDPMTASAYVEWQNSDMNGDYPTLNNMFRKAIAAHARENFSRFVYVPSMLTHYNLVNYFLAGTDNCSKNTYYTTNPEDGLVWLYQDDMDTILKTDNNGRQTKVYFLDRINDEADYEAGYKLQADYEGKYNALFNLIEAAYEEFSPYTEGCVTLLASNMREVLSAMTAVVDVDENILGIDKSINKSIWGCMNKYFFSIQRYFPQYAYNEQARLRYEWPASIGFVSTGNQARTIAPITQSIGNQLESELQYMKRRIALACSYAGWGDFSAGVVPGAAGLEDTNANLSLSPGSGNVGGTYKFEVVPHQFIYPTGYKDRTLVNDHVRVAPGERYPLEVASISDGIRGDSAVGLAAIHYYREIGNLGSMVVGNNSLQVLGNRMTKFTVHPASPTASFAPKALVVSAPNLVEFDICNASAISGQLNLTNQARLKIVDLRNTALTMVYLPTSDTMTTLRLPSTLTSLNVTGHTVLTEFSVDGVSTLNTLVAINNNNYVFKEAVNLVGKYYNIVK